MWEAITNIATSERFVSIAVVAGAFVVAFAVLVKMNLIDIDTNHVKIGMSDSDKERRIITEQLDWAESYIAGLESKIRMVTPDLKYGGYFTKFILAEVTREVSRWIKLNHIDDSEGYIHSKQMKIASLVYAQNVQAPFLDPEFKSRMDRWVEEVIRELIKIRRLYSK